MASAQSHLFEVGLPSLEPVRLHYVTHGNPGRPAVFCVHGLTGNAHDFDFLAAALAEDFFVIAPDIPGRGLSSHLNDTSFYTNENYLRWSFALLEHLHVTSVHWIGASMGGILGMMACLAYPFMIRTLMLNDVGSVLAKEGLRDIIRYTGGPRRSNTDNAAFIRRMRENAAPFDLQGKEEWEHFFQHRVKTDASGHYQMRYDPAVVDPLKTWAEAGEGDIGDLDIGILWRAVHCPVLLFRGEHSLLLRRSDAMQMQQDAPGQTTYHEIPVAGHMPNLMRKDQIIIIREWLKRQPSFTIL